MTEAEEKEYERQIAEIIAANRETFAFIRKLMALNGQMLRVQESVVEESAEERIMIACPRCGAEQEDFDGFGVLHCEACGYCTHPSASGDICDVCGAFLPPAATGMIQEPAVVEPGVVVEDPTAYGMAVLLRG